MILKCLGVLVFSGLMSVQSYAGTIGTLTLNDSVINNTAGGVSYLNLSDASQLTYSETVTATGVGGTYADYHIASQNEAYAFWHALGGVGADTTGGTSHTTSVNSLVDGILGDNYNDIYDYAWFLSDEATEVGYLKFDSEDGNINISDQWGSIAYADTYIARGNGISWLLVEDATIPEPSILALMGLGLLGLFSAKRRKVNQC